MIEQRMRHRVCTDLDQAIRMDSNNLIVREDSVAQPHRGCTARPCAQDFEQLLPLNCGSFVQTIVYMREQGFASAI